MAPLKARSSAKQEYDVFSTEGKKHKEVQPDRSLKGLFAYLLKQSEQIGSDETGRLLSNRIDSRMTTNSRYFKL